MRARPVFRPIGFVRSPARETVDEGWGAITSQIRLEPELAAGLLGLGDFSHALVVTHLHGARFVPERDLVRRPRGRADMPGVGIFAQRAKDRPNALGVTAVRILEVGEGTLTVQGLDAVDGTPVLDIKPYVPLFDRVESPRVPEWMGRLMEGYL
jgi:tRNA-Thr(GGU) m(6)t(6)A37 methyltransferase TsaA